MTHSITVGRLGSFRTTRIDPCYKYVADEKDRRSQLAFGTIFVVITNANATTPVIPMRATALFFSLEEFNQQLA